MTILKKLKLFNANTTTLLLSISYKLISYNRPVNAQIDEESLSSNN